MTTFTIGDTAKGHLKVSIPELIGTKALIQANSGGGKSWLLRIIAEQSVGSVPVVILDPEGEFATLRERYDFALAGHDGELGISVDTAARLARKVVEFRIPAIVNLSDLKDLDEKREYVRLFLEAFIGVPRKLWSPMMIVVDEAHRFAPKQGVASSTDAMKTLGDAGRKRGFCGIFATQRLSKLHNDVEAECNNVFIGRTWLDNDQERAGDLLGMRKADRLVLRDLPPGQFFAFGPALSVAGVSRFQSGQVRTTHPRPGELHTMAVPKASAHIREIVEQIGDLPAQVKAERDEVDALRKRVGELERELRARPATQLPLAPEPIRVEVPVFKDGEVGRLEKAICEVSETSAQLSRVGQALVTLAGHVGPIAHELSGAMQAVINRPAPRASAPLSAARPAAAPARSTTTLPAGALASPQQRIVDSLAWLETIGIDQADKVQLALLAEQSPKSSGYSNNLGALRSAGIIDYPGPGRVALTEQGRGAAVYPETPPTTETLQASILARLPAPKAAIVKALIDVYPESITKDDLASIVNQSPTSSGYSNNLGNLRSLGLLDYPKPGHVVARPVLFVN